MTLVLDMETFGIHRFPMLSSEKLILENFASIKKVNKTDRNKNARECSLLRFYLTFLAFYTIYADNISRQTIFTKGT